jgi:hypothetical protein
MLERNTVSLSETPRGGRVRHSLICSPVAPQPLQTAYGRHQSRRHPGKSSEIISACTAEARRLLLTDSLRETSCPGKSGLVGAPSGTTVPCVSRLGSLASDQTLREAICDEARGARPSSTVYVE